MKDVKSFMHEHHAIYISFTYFSLFSILLVTLFPNSLNAQAPTQTLPTLTIDSTTINVPSDNRFDVPINFAANGHSLISGGFSIDYDETCLTFDTTNGLSGVNNPYQSVVTHDATDADGEIDIAIWEGSGAATAFPDGVLAMLTFEVLAGCITTDGTARTVSINFSADPSPSFGDTGGNTVNGSTTGATMTLHFNVAPTDITLDNTVVVENEPSGTLVGTLLATDVNISDTHSYGLVGGDMEAFVISNNELQTTRSFDYEAQSSYLLTIRTDDGDETFDKGFTIMITNVNEAPIAVDDPAINDPAIVVVGGTEIDVLANDSDPEVDAGLGVSLTISAVSGGSNGIPSIGDEGNTIFFTPTAGYSGVDTFTYVVSDGEFSEEGTVTLNILAEALPGDCNGDGVFGAGDFTAISLELFDGDDDQPWYEASNQGFPGNPVGCDTNGNQQITVADIQCAVNLFFGDDGCAANSR
ncbi:MAG: Ig-like domain-containing protein [Chloroflexota bacterium]